MAMCFSNNKQNNIIYIPTCTVPPLLCFTVDWLRLTLIQNCLKKYQTLKECISCNGKVLVKLKITTGKHKLIDSEEGYRRHGRQDNWCIW